MEHKSNGLYLLFIAMAVALGALSVLAALAGLKVTTIVLIVFTCIPTCIVVSGIYITPSDGPYIGIVKKWGEYLWETDDSGEPIVVYIKNGWSWFFLLGIRKTVELHRATTREHDEKGQILITPDGATTRVNWSVSYLPNPKKLVDFITTHEDDGVLNFLTTLVQKTLLDWAADPHDGPKTFRELMSSSGEATILLTKKICGDNNVSKDHIDKISAGKGELIVPGLGIELIKLVITNFEPFGKVYEEAINVDRENEQEKSELHNVDTDIKVANKMYEAAKSKGDNVTWQQCFDKVVRNKNAAKGTETLSLNAIANALGFKKGENE